MFYTSLPQRGLLALSGADAENFLQGLISNDLRKLVPGAMLYAAMLSPQGKFLHDFFLIRRGELILLDCDSARVNDLVSRLTLYKLRAAVTIEKLSEKVMAVWDSNSLPLEGEGGATRLGEAEALYIDIGHKASLRRSQERRVEANSESAHSIAPLPTSPLKGGGEIFPDPRLPEMGYRIIGVVDTQDWQQADVAAYEKHRLTLGVPDGAQDMIIDKSFLLELGFEQLHGVDFNKGCYVGQEVTARSKFRGQVRKHLYQVRGEGELPPLGTKIMQEGAEVGEVRSHAGNIGLAILRIEAVEKNSPLTANEKPIAASFPIWAKVAAA